jgi:hypothetical protein
MATPPAGGNSHVLDLNLLREQLVSCSGENCPEVASTQSDCPLYELRRLKQEQIRAWLDGLNSAEMDFLVQYQQACRVANRDRNCSPGRWRM